jgi:hypothetical protein
MEFKNSDIRKTILREHEQLRALMSGLQAQLEAASEAVPASLPEALQVFLDEFLRHIAHEEAILRPALAHVADAWAQERVEAMDAEHGEQRDRLRALAQAEPWADPKGFVQRARETLEWIRLDMAGEEKSLLGPELLRDDIIILDSFGG